MRPVSDLARGNSFPHNSMCDIPINMSNCIFHSTWTPNNRHPVPYSFQTLLYSSLAQSTIASYHQPVIRRVFVFHPSNCLSSRLPTIFRNVCSTVFWFFRVASENWVLSTSRIRGPGIGPSVNHIARQKIFPADINTPFNTILHTIKMLSIALLSRSIYFSIQ